MFYIAVHNDDDDDDDDEGDVPFWLFPHLPVYFYMSRVHMKKCVCHFTNRRSQRKIKRVLNRLFCFIFNLFFDGLCYVDSFRCVK